MPARPSPWGINALVFSVIILGGVTAISFPYIHTRIGAGAIKDLYANGHGQVSARIANIRDTIADEILIAVTVSTFEALKSLSNPFCVVFLSLFLVKYVRLVGNSMAVWSIKPIKPPRPSSYTSKNVTVIIPTTMENESDLVDCIESIRDNKPAQIILVTKKSKCALAYQLCNKFYFQNIKIVGVSRLSKRLQLVEALESVKTAITVFADDDVVWGRSHLTCLLAPMQNHRIGAVGSGMRCIRKPNPNLWNFLGIAYLERRNFNTGATNHIDGGISTLSGRTALYRTEIVQDPSFCDAFLKDNWNGRVLNTDDDKFITKWLFSRGWKIHLQFAEEATLYTSLGATAGSFLAQCLRWARAHWRGNIRVVTSESYWYKTHPWTCYATYFGSLLTPSVVIDSLLLYLFHKWMVSINVDSASYTAGMIVLVLWIGFTKIVKLIPHFYRFPGDMKFIPASILFGYLHGFINMYALLTLNKTTWGSRAVVDNPTPVSGTDNVINRNGVEIKPQLISDKLMRAGYMN